MGNNFVGGKSVGVPDGSDAEADGVGSGVADGSSDGDCGGSEAVAVGVADGLPDGDGLPLESLPEQAASISDNSKTDNSDSDFPVRNFNMC